MKKPKFYLILGIIFLVASFVFTILVKTFNVAEIGETMTPVGFSDLNNVVFQAIDTNLTLYKITDILGFLPILVATGYAVFGLIQLIKRKKLLEVDRGLLVLGGLLAFTFVLYIFFNTFALNYRPVFIDGELESSFPSSHTMLMVVICSSIIFLNLTYYSTNKFARVLNIFLALLAIFIILGRVFSGVHWITDIFGGLLYALTLLSFYLAILKKTQKLHC